MNRIKILVVSIISILVLTACGGIEEDIQVYNQEPQVEDQEPQVEATGEATLQVEITVKDDYNSSVFQAGYAIYTQEGAEFIGSYPAISKIKHRLPAGPPPGIGYVVIFNFIDLHKEPITAMPSLVVGDEQVIPAVYVYDRDS